MVDLCEGLAQEGHDVTILTFDDADVPEAWRNRESTTPRVMRLKRSALPRSFVSRDGMRQVRHVTSRAQVVHLHTPWALGNLQLACLLRAACIPYVVTVHGMLDNWSMGQKPLKKRAFLTVAGRRLLGHAAAVHFTARDERAQALRWIPAKAKPRMFVAPYLVDLSAFREPPGSGLARRAFPFIRSDVPRILFLSRLHHKKGVDLLIFGSGTSSGQWPRVSAVAGGSLRPRLGSAAASTRGKVSAE